MGNLKLCKDGRIWGQNNKEAGSHLGRLSPAKYNIYSWGKNPNSNGRPFGKGEFNPKWCGGPLITKEGFDELNKKQDGLCAICGKEETRRTKNGMVCHLTVDHSHSTNVIRGLLCHKCNVGLGLFGDDTDVMERAIDYLKGEKNHE